MAEGKRRYAVDLTGQRFGKLLVLRKVKVDGPEASRWECKCDCGNIYLIRSTGLLRKKPTTSCGCYTDVRECVKCHVSKSSEFFRSKVKGKICLECRGENQRVRWNAWRDKNRELVNEKSRQYRSRRYDREGRWSDSGPKARAAKEWMLELKSNPCADCGNSFETCSMDFDHRDGTVKLYNIGTMFSNHYSKDLIDAELAKCDLVCANCHRVRTRDRRTGKRLK